MKLPFQMSLDQPLPLYRSTALPLYHSATLPLYHSTTLYTEHREHRHKGKHIDSDDTAQSRGTTYSREHAADLT